MSNQSSQDKLKGFCPHGKYPDTCPLCLTERSGNLSKNGTESSEQDNIEAWLEEIRNSEPKVGWVTYIPDKSYGVIISLPHECAISATLSISGDKSRTMKIDVFQVNEELRSKGAGTGSGIGTRLLIALVKEAKEYEATTLFGHVTSKSALGTRAKVCGKENLEFYNHQTGVKLDTTYEEAMQEHNEINEQNLDYDVAADVSKIKLE